MLKLYIEYYILCVHFSQCNNEMKECDFVPITVEHQKESLGSAYVHAVIAKAGYNSVGKPEFDYGYDGKIFDVVDRGGRYAETGVGLNYQLKSSSNVSFRDGKIYYDLKVTNYNDLAAPRVMLPSILILFVLPEVVIDWLDISCDNMIIKKCAWWCSLEGQPLTTNTSTKTISIPTEQIFSPEALIEIMKKVQGGDNL